MITDFRWLRLLLQSILYLGKEGSQVTPESARETRETLQDELNKYTGNSREF